LRPGEASFYAYRNPPVVEMISPKENGQLAPSQRVEFSVRGPSPVTEVDLVADGKPLTTLRGEPWVYEWDTQGMSHGQHSLSVLAGAGPANQSTRVVRLVVPGAGLERELLSRPMGAPPRPGAGPDMVLVMLGLMGLGALVAGGYYGKRSLLPLLAKRRPSRCP